MDKQELLDFAGLFASQNAGQRDGIKNGQRLTQEDDFEKLGVKLGEKLGENQIKIVQLMINNRKISIKELSKLVGISETAIEKNISKLQDKNIIKRVGPAKGGSWEIIK